MKAVAFILAALLLVSAALNVILGAEVRGLQLVALDRYLEIKELQKTVRDKGDDATRERLYQADVNYLYSVISAYEKKKPRPPLPSWPILTGDVHQYATVIRRRGPE